MKEYRLELARLASQDMEQLYDYIAKQFQAPAAALRVYNRIADGIESLRTFPARCKLLDSEPERSLGMRQLIVGKYSVIYMIKGDSVRVLRVLYSASDIPARLREKQWY